MYLKPRDLAFKKRIEWTPLVKGGSNFVTHKLVEKSDEIVVKRDFFLDFFFDKLFIIGLSKGIFFRLKDIKNRKNRGFIYHIYAIQNNREKYRSGKL